MAEHVRDGSRGKEVAVGSTRSFLHQDGFSTPEYKCTAFIGLPALKALLSSLIIDCSCCSAQEAQAILMCVYLYTLYCVAVCICIERAHECQPVAFSMLPCCCLLKMGSMVTMGTFIMSPTG